MIINFSPVRMDEKLQVKVEGDSIFVNGEEFDFSPLPEGSSLRVLEDDLSRNIDSKWFAGIVSRNNGIINVTVVLPHGPNAPESTRSPSSINVTEDGEVELPIYDIVVEDSLNED